MAPRALRRARQGKDFIPVYFYTGRPPKQAAVLPEEPEINQDGANEFYQPTEAEPC